VHITYDDLHHYSQGKSGRFRVFVIENHLRGCALCSARLGEVLKLLSSKDITPPSKPLPLPSPKNRRREPRIPTDDPGVLQVIAPFSSTRVPVRVVDVSKSGLQLLLDIPLEPGSTVKIRIREAVLFAEIRHCRQIKPDEYRAGLVLQEVIAGHEIVRVASATD
jgi:hypothetical protein